MSRIDRNRDLYESWPIEIRQAVLDGKVEPGMTPDMVRVSWGEPSEIVAQSHDGDEIWVFVRGGSDGSIMYPGSAGYPSMGGSTGSIAIGSGGRGGMTIGTGVGMGGSTIGMGGGGIMGPSGAPIVIPPTPPDIREVVFRKGIVSRADAP